MHYVLTCLSPRISSPPCISPHSGLCPRTCLRACTVGNSGGSDGHKFSVPGAPTPARRSASLEVPAGSPHVLARCGSVGPLGDGEVHPHLHRQCLTTTAHAHKSHLPPVKLLAVHRPLGLLRLLDRLEVDESEAPAEQMCHNYCARAQVSPAALGVAVQHHLALLNVTESSELFLKLLLRRVETEAKDSKTLKRNNVH